jgi:transcriptional regulator with XRE-family HTH domain
LLKVQHLSTASKLFLIMGRKSAAQAEKNRFLRALRYLIAEKSLSLKEIGERSGIDPDELSRFLSKKKPKPPGEETIKKFNAVFSEETKHIPYEFPGASLELEVPAQNYGVQTTQETRSKKVAPKAQSEAEFLRQQLTILNHAHLESALTSRTSAEAFKTSAEASRISAEAFKTSADANRTSAEASKISAEACKVSAEAFNISALAFDKVADVVTVLTATNSKLVDRQLGSNGPSPDAGS